MTKAAPTSVAIVVVSYNTKSLLRACLQSIERCQRYTPRVALTTIVIDNASHDGSAQMVAGEFPETILLDLPQNTGFTGGNNLALSLLGFPIYDRIHLGQAVPPTRPADTGDFNCARTRLPTKPPQFVLLLNADAALTEYALITMLDAMRDHQDAAVCGPSLRYGDGTFQHGAFHFPGLAQVLIDLFPLPKMPGWHRVESSRLNGRYPAALWAGIDPFEVDFVLGAAMLIRGAAIRQIGGLDSAYFMYCEEMDWCLRSRAAGWRAFAVPVARVVHHAGQSSNQVRWSAYTRLWCNRLRFFRKHKQRYPRPQLALLQTAIAAGMAYWSRATRRAFFRGQCSGIIAQERLAAYTTIWQACSGHHQMAARDLHGTNSIAPQPQGHTPQ